MGITVNGRVYDIAITKGATTYGMMVALTQGELRQRDNDFAPIIGVPGAQMEYAEGIWRPWTLSDFRGGLGQEDWKDPTCFYQMTPGLRFSKGRIQLDTQFYNEDSGDTKTKGVDFGANHYAITGNAVKKRIPAGTWSISKDFGVPVTDLCVFQGELQASTWGSKIWHTPDGTTWTQHTDTPGVYIGRMIPFRNALWVADNTQMWYRQKKADGSWAWFPDHYWESQVGAIQICEPGNPFGLQGLAVLGGVIIIGRHNGIYVYEGSGNRAEGPVIDFENMVWGGNCKLFTVVDGFLYYNVGNRIKKTDMQGAEFDITPMITGDAAKERYGFGIPVGGQGYQGHIYVAFDDMEGLYPVVLEMPTIDVGGWRKVYEGTSGATMYGAWLSDAQDRLFASDGTTRSQRFQSHTDAPYPDYVSTAYLITSRFDASDVWSKKIFASILMYARELSATETIALYYEKDYSGTWVLIGTATSGRQIEMIFDPTTIAISARKLWFKIVLSRGADTSKTPILQLPLVASYVVRPDPTYAQQVVIRLQDNITTHDGKPVEQSASTLKAFLRLCEAYEFPLVYTDRYGEAWNVIVSRTQEIRNYFVTSTTGIARVEDVMMVTFKEV